MKKIINKKLFLTLLPILILVFFVAGNFVLAEAPAPNSGGVGDAVTKTSGFVFGALGTVIASVVGIVATIITSVIGLIITVMVQVLVDVANFNDIINVPTVVTGWVVIRDLCNMFFILILLVIAFATILKIETYSLKKTLPKVLIMAVLINFSKSIFGLMIDASTLVMLTFTQAFATGGGYFIEAFGIKNWLSIPAGDTFQKVKQGDNFGLSQWTTILAMVSSVIAALITLIVVAVMLAILIMRVVFLWIYTMLSPLVFLGFAFPPIQKYTGQIWEDFIKQLVVGPVLAFFLWIALFTVSSGGNFNGTLNKSLDSSTVAVCANSAFFCNKDFQRFLLTIGLLMGGLMVAQQAGGAAGKIAGIGLDWAKKSGSYIAKSPLDVAGWGARKLKSSEGRFGGIELNPVNIYKGIKMGFEEKKRKEEAEGQAKSADALRKGGVSGLFKGLGASQDMTEAMARGWFGIKGVKLAYQTSQAPKRRKVLEEKEEKRDKIKKEIDSHKAELSELENKKLAGTATIGEKIRISELRNKAKEINDKENEVDNLNLDIKKYKVDSPIRSPYTFAANQGRQKMVREATAKIGDNDNSEDLVDMYNHAKAVGDKELAAAVFLAAAKNGHSNEIIQSQKGTGTWKDKSNTFENKTYDTNQDGLNAFVREQLMGAEGLGMAEQEALAYQSEFSSICKKVGHYMFAESVGSKSGMLTQRTAKDQQMQSRAEGRKEDQEKYIRARNRFGYGFETENEAGKREFRFDRIGLEAVMENAAIIEVELGKERFNRNAAMKMQDDFETLRKYIEATGQKTYTVNEKGKEPIIKYWADLLKKLEIYGKAVQSSGSVSSQAAADKVLDERSNNTTSSSSSIPGSGTV